MKEIIFSFIFLTRIALFAQAPGDIGTDLTLWLKADAGTNTTTNGGSIISWTDQSANGFDATGTGGAVYSESAINYNPSIEFLATAKPFTGSISRPNSTASTVFIVQKKNTISSNASDGESFIELGNGTTRRQFIFDNRYSGNEIYNPSINTGVANIITVSDLGGSGNGSIFENGELINTTNGGFETSWASGQYFIGDDATGGDALTGDISEIVYYDRELTTTEIKRVESYLAVKYGVTRNNNAGGEAGDYVTSGGNVIWDASDNATYHHHIIGLGKDDDTTLDQTKSTDANEFLTIDKDGSFGTDLDYIIVGSDDNSLILAPTNVPTGIVTKSQRTWKVETHGTPGLISVSFTLGGDIANTTDASNYELLIDNDTDFTNASKHTTGATIVGNVLTFTDVPLSDGGFFSLGVNIVTLTPGAVYSGIVSWFKADSGTSSTVNGANLTQWNNNVANTHAVVPGSVTSDQPQYQENIHNFNPSVYFANGDNGYFNVDLDAINNTDYNIISVVERQTDNLKDYFIGTEQEAANEGLHVGYRNNNTLTIDQFATDLDVSVSNFDDPLVSRSLIRAQLNSSSGKTIQELRDGNYATASDVNTSFLTGNHQGRLGKGYDNDGMIGYVSEVIVYDEVLSNTELSKIYSYLAVKYGMTLSTSDAITNGNYINSDGDVIWNATTNASYHNEVIGIGKDDNSTLSQQKSVEPTTSSLAVTIDKTTSFSNNKDFILIGNDGGTIGTTTTGIHAAFTDRVERTWKAQVSGTPGTISMSFTLGGAIANTGNAYDYGVLIDTDTNFSDATMYNTGVTLVGDVLTFVNVPLSDGAVFTLGVGSTANGPGDVFGALALWLKADAGTNTTTDGVGVTEWDDQGENGNDATGAGTALYSESSINYNPSIEFLNTANPLTGTINRAVGAASTVFIVQKKNVITATPTDGESFIELGTGGNRQFVFDYRYSGNNPYSLTTEESSIISVSDLGGSGNANVFENGNLIAASTGGFNTSWTSGEYTIGDDRTGGDELTGDISEILYYDRDLADEERKKIESYLAIKYGVTLNNSAGGSAGNYIASDGTIEVWNATTNVDYHHNVTVIGQDEDSNLYQKQSQSEGVNGVLTVALGAAVEASNVLNTNNFDNDLDFLAIGSKSTSTVFAIECGAPVLKVNRDWKVQNTGSVGAVTLQFDMTGISAPGDFDLLIDTDGSFDDTLNQSTTAPSGPISGNNLTFSGITLTDGAVFTLVRKAGYEITYNGGAWTRDAGANVAPNTSDAGKRVNVESSVEITESFNCDCLKVDSGQVLTVPTTDYIAVKELVLNGDIYLEGDSELIQTEVGDTYVNSGSGNVHKILDDATKSEFRYNYYASPVNTSGSITLASNLKFNEGATLGDNTDPSFTRDLDGFETTISTRWTHTFNNDPAEFFEINENTSIPTGVGFTMKGTGTLTPNKYNFIGAPNNGEISVSLTAGNYLLTGNPYPSTIDGHLFNAMNNSVTEGILYLWDQPNGDVHFNALTDNSGGYATITDNMTAPAAAILEDESTPVTGATTPTQYIRPGQGFIVYGDATGAVEFDNSLRDGVIFDGDRHFFKTNKLKSLRQIIRLGFEYTLDNGKVFHRQLATALEGSTLAKEKGKDAFMFDYFNNDAYWVIPGEEDRFVITSVPFPSSDLALPIGVTVDKEREVTFKLDDVEGVSGAIYLWDNVENKITNIKNASHKVMIQSGEVQDRFSLVFDEQATLDFESPDDNTKTMIYTKNNQIHIVLEKGNIETVEVFNFAGEKILSHDVTKLTNSAIVSSAKLNSQMYIIKIVSDNNTITKKVIID